ncbi:hypothetical protein AAC387_Pa03g1839 [Persea americana]
MRRKRQKTKSSISLRLLFFSRYLASFRILLKGMVPALCNSRKRQVRGNYSEPGCWREACGCVLRNSY